MSRHGKIAQLPYEVREELNGRLLDGMTGVEVLQWLNELPEVRAVMARSFEGRPVNAQNLSDWREGGYRDWLRGVEARRWLGTVEEEEGLDGVDRVAVALTAELGRSLYELAQVEMEPLERQRALLSVARAIAQLRRGEPELERLRFEEQRWNEQRLAEAREKASTARMISRYFRQRSQKEAVSKAASSASPAAMEPGLGQAQGAVSGSSRDEQPPAAAEVGGEGGDSREANVSSNAAPTVEAGESAAGLGENREGVDRGIEGSVSGAVGGRSESQVNQGESS